jgi:hypothetical protein
VFERVIVSVLLLSFSSFTRAQEVKVRGHFVDDSIQLGKPISYFLTARYPKESTVVFPDSSYSFAPFEFQKKRFVATQTINGISYDSVIYTLSTFEIDSIQSLTLPVFVVQEKDCTLVYAEEGAVFFDKAVKSLPDSVQLEKIPLKTNTNYFTVSWLFNYPLVAIILGVLLVILIVCWIIFGKIIIRYFKIKRISKKHQTFLLQFNAAVEKSQSTFSSQSTENALLIWKNYLENLTDVPFTKYTTKEIREHEKNEQLGQSLSAIDRMIYANQPGEKEYFINLKTYSEDQFHKKLEKLKNG